MFLHARFSMRCLWLILVGASLAVPSRTRADETPATSKIVSVDLFKNGLAIVRREAMLGKPGTYVLDDVPDAIHGTYWVDSSAPVETVVKTREVDVPLADVVPGILQDDFAGKKVTIHFRGEKLPPVVGTVAKFKLHKSEDAVALRSRYLIVETAKGRTYVESSEIATVEAESGDGKVKRRRSQLSLTLGNTDKPETKVVIRYLTRGLAWAPSYKIDISDPKTLTLEQHAVVKNELADLTDAELRLISGFPSVQFGHVRSLMSNHTSMTVFFNELSSRVERYSEGASNSVIMNQSMGNFRSPVATPNLGAIPTGEGVDLHYESIGKRTLADGDALSLMVAKGSAKYERIVEWLVPDTRDTYGRAVEGQSANEEDSPWDALRFQNPLSFPMTTGPAMVVADGKFNGQRTSYWTNAGEETVLRVEKALSVRTRSLENEDPKEGNRDLIWIGGRQYRRSTVDGEIAVNNHRKETIQLLVRRRFSGELVSAEGDPKSSLREEGVHSVNKRNELLWTIPLKAGEERKLKYRYSVLVLH